MAAWPSASGQGASGTLAYTGTWANTTCACFLWEHTRRTSQSGARMTFTRTYEQGDQVSSSWRSGPDEDVLDGSIVVGPASRPAPDPQPGRTFTARAITRIAVTNAMTDCTSIVIFAHIRTGRVSVGLNAVEFVNER